MRTPRFQLIKFERFKINTTLATSPTEPVEFSKGNLIVDLDVKTPHVPNRMFKLFMYCREIIIPLKAFKLSLKNTI